jgi:hypothetical protein
MIKAIGAILSGLAVFILGVAEFANHQRINALETRVSQILAQPKGSTVPATAPKRLARAWPSLGMDKTIEIGEAIKAAKSKPMVTIFCASPECWDLSTDIDDAFQIADWPSDIERRPAMTGFGESAKEPDGIVLVGFPDTAAMLAALQKAGLPVTMRELPPIPAGMTIPTAIVIGKYRR